MEFPTGTITFKTKTKNTRKDFLLSWAKSLFTEFHSLILFCDLFFYLENPSNVLFVGDDLNWENVRKGVPKREKEVKELVCYSNRHQTGFHYFCGHFS